MRVLHVFKDFFPPTYGGIEQHIADVAGSTAGEFDVEVLTSSRSLRASVEDRDGVRVRRSRELARPASTPVTPGWWRSLRRSRADVVHVHLPNPMAAAVLAVGARPGRVVVTYHADVQRSPRLASAYLPVEQRMLARADHVVVGSPVLLETSPALAPHLARAVVIPYGVDPQAWPADPAAIAGIRERAGRPLVLFLGRLVHYKGLEVLIEAMRSVDAHLVVAGDGPLRDGLQAAALAAGLQGRVQFIGNVTNQQRSAYYAAADVFVLPATSRAESFGIAMLEAMSHGTPAISTEVGTGTSWVNRSGETGLVIPPGDPVALAEAATILLSDDTRRKQLGEGAARRARLHFSRHEMLAGLTSLYRNCGESTSR